MKVAVLNYTGSVGKTVVASHLLAALIQTLSANLGIATGHNLA